MKRAANSFRESRAEAKEVIARGKGLPNRTAGAFSVPADGMKEPERTERLLNHPFTLRHQVAGDAYQARAGFQLFRVNALSPVGYFWRFAVLCVNVFTGVLGGLTPLFAQRGPTSIEALAQVSALLGLQLTMAWVCFYVRPDADKVFSYFAGSQFLLEALGTVCRLWTVLQPHVALLGDTEALAFTLALVAIFVPLLQLVEAKIFQPVVKSLRKHDCDAMQIVGILCLLLLSVPRQIKAACALLTGTEPDTNDGIDEEKVAKGASALLIKTMANGKDLKRKQLLKDDPRKKKSADDDDDGDDDDDAGDDAGGDDGADGDD